MRNPITTGLLICRGDPGDIGDGLCREREWGIVCLVLIVGGAGMYGATIGLWRDAIQALYTGIKFPLLVLFLTAGNALINGMLAQLMGQGITFRQSCLVILTSFALASVILGSLSPITLFLWFNTPPRSAGNEFLSHSFMLISHVFIIGTAGVISNMRLLRLLIHMSGDRGAGVRILSSWFAVNVFLGCQLSWIMRPFAGSPGLPVQFLRDNAFEGNFYEITFQALKNLLG